MYKKQKGFTIIELLIVIVVIGILAAITIVAYNGVQNRANNNTTIQAANTYVKAMKMYKADYGRWPNGWVCLGENYLYGVSGTDTTGTAQCRQTNTTGYIVSASFNNLLRPYLNGTFPDPAFTTTVSPDSTQWRRGIHYAYGGGSGTEVYLNISFAGDLSSCPVIQGVSGNRNAWTGGTMCSYTLGSTTDT